MEAQVHGKGHSTLSNTLTQVATPVRSHNLPFGITIVKRSTAGKAILNRMNTYNRAVY